MAVSWRPRGLRREDVLRSPDMLLDCVWYQPLKGRLHAGLRMNRFPESLVA